METIPREVKTPPRPDGWDEHVKKATAEAILPKVLRWLKDNGCDHVDDEDEAAEVLEDLIAIADEEDGYHACKALEREHWDCDRELVDILDGLPHLLYKAEKAAVEAWVTAYGVTVPFAVGDRVRVVKGYRHKGEEGEVKGLYPGTAQVSVVLASVSNGFPVFAVERIERVEVE